MIQIRSINVSMILVGLWLAQLWSAIPTSLLILTLLFLASTYFEYRDEGFENPSSRSASRPAGLPPYLEFFRALHWLLHSSDWRPTPQFPAFRRYPAFRSGPSPEIPRIQRHLFSRRGGKRRVLKLNRLTSSSYWCPAWDIRGSSAASESHASTPHFRISPALSATPRDTYDDRTEQPNSLETPLSHILRSVLNLERLLQRQTDLMASKSESSDSSTGPLTPAEIPVFTYPLSL